MISENNLIILENYKILLEKALFNEYIKSANKSISIKNKFREIDTNLPSGFKYLNNPSKEQEVEIFKQISRSDTFKKVIAGLAVGGLVGTGMGVLYNKFKLESKYKKDIEEHDRNIDSASKKVGKIEGYKNKVTSDIQKSGDNSENMKNSLNPVDKSLNNAKDKLNSAVDAKNKTISSYKSQSYKNTAKGSGIGLAVGSATGLAALKMLSRNIKHINISGRKVYAVVSKDSKTIYDLALPYSNGSKIIVKYVKASVNKL